MLVYTDESFIHQHYAARFAWLKANKPRVRGRPRDNGTRLIMLNAISAQGVLSTRLDMAEATNDVADPQPTAQFVFESMGQGEDEYDYHKTINGELYIAWVRNRLLPAFRHKHPGKRMVLVLDNASYHRVRQPLTVTPSQMTRVQCVSYMQHHHMPSIRSPKLTDVRAHIALHHEASPFTQLAALLEANGHEALWTPPYESDTQPIELYWALVKGAVARTIAGTRSADRMRAAIDAAMLAVTPEQCQRLIAHVHHWLDEWLSDAVQGGLLAVRYPTLESMVSAAAAGTFDTTGLVD
jgi:transposase